MINFDISFNLSATISSALGWGIVVYFIYYQYKKQTVKPKIWKLVLILFVGLFTFSLQLNWLNVWFNLPILPLGVWVLFLFFRKNEVRWKTYRPYAWLGFSANFIFIAASLLAVPLQQVIYPKEELSTYISNVQQAEIIQIHPSAKNQILNKESLQTQLQTMKKERVYSDTWYETTFLDTEAKVQDEMFPYHLASSSSKWGSGIESIIYIENDGKGILITTSDDQLYFRAEKAFLEGVE